MIKGSSLQTTVHKLLCHQERARILSQFIRYTFRKVWFTVTYQDLYKILKQDNLDIYTYFWAIRMQSQLFHGLSLSFKTVIPLSNFPHSTWSMQVSFGIVNPRLNLLNL